MILCLIGIFAILSSTMSKNPVLNPFAESLGTPVIFMGLVAVASTLPGVLISFPAGSLSDSFGRRKMIAVSTFVFALAPFLYLLVNSWWQLVLVRFFHGFATAVFIPVARAAIADYYPLKKGERISTFTSATMVGRGLAPFIGGFILSATFWNFQILYLGVGIAGSIALFISLVFLNSKHVSPKNQLLLKKINHPQNDPQKVRLEWKDVVTNKGVLIVSTTEAASRYVYGALEFFFIGYLMKVAQLDPSLIGIIMGAQFITIPLLSPVMGRFSDKIGRTIPILLGLLLSGLPLFFIPYITDFLPLLLISLTYGFGFSTIISSTPALVTDLVNHKKYGTAMGLLATIMDIGQMLGPIITGMILASFGYSISFFSLGIILISITLLFGGYQKFFQRRA